jgi:hypothetical protein
MCVSMLGFIPQQTWSQKTCTASTTSFILMAADSVQETSFTASIMGHMPLEANLAQSGVRNGTRCVINFAQRTSINSEFRTGGRRRCPNNEHSITPSGPQINTENSAVIRMSSPQLTYSGPFPSACTPPTTISP